MWIGWSVVSIAIVSVVLVKMLMRGSSQAKLEAADAVGALCSGCHENQVDATAAGLAGPLLRYRDSAEGGEVGVELSNRCTSALIAMQFLHLQAEHTLTHSHPTSP